MARREIIKTVQVVFYDEDRGTVAKLERLRRKMGVKAVSAVLRRAVDALWSELYPNTEGGAK